MVGISALRALFGRFLQARQSAPNAWVEPSNAVTRAIEGEIRAAYEQAYAEAAAAVPAPAYEAAPVYQPAPSYEAAPAAAPVEKDSRAA